MQKQEWRLSQNNKLVVSKYVIRSLAVINSVTGSPQGTVLSPVLFTLYTNDCTGTDTTPIIKYSDDSGIEDLSNSDSVYFAEVERFSNWCRDNSLDLNVKKTKEMLTDLRKTPTVIPDLFIDGMKVERVTEYKYLGRVLGNKLNLNKNIDFIHKRCHPRIFCLQMLRSLNVSATVLCTFYQSWIKSVLTFSFLCWFGGLNVKSKMSWIKWWICVARLWVKANNT